jgi:hypothetical protein
MSDAFRKLYQGQVPASATTLYTVPAVTTAIVKHIRAVNGTASDRTLKLWHDGTADANLILPAATIVAGGWAEFDGNILMEAGDTLSGQASVATAITVTVYGDEVTE